jgi:hypothetical protein
MIKTALVTVAILAIAAPAFAKGKKADTAPAGWENAAPIAYSELPAADAKINGTASKKKAPKSRKVSENPAEAGSSQHEHPAQ